MKYRKYILPALISMILFFSACKKEDSDVFLPDNGQQMIADTNWVTTINALMPVSLLKGDLALPLYKDTITLNNTVSNCNSLSGIECTLPSNSILDSNGNPVKGKIIVESLLIERPGDMIRMSTSSRSNTMLLNTDAMLYLNLANTSGNLKLAAQQLLNIQYQSPPDTAKLQLFNGMSGSSGINWYPDANATSTINPTSYGYTIYTSHLGWIGCANSANLNSSQNVNLAVTAAKQFTNANTEAWLVFNHHKTAINLEADPANRQFKMSGIPSSREATVIMISRQVNDYYLGAVDIITGTGSGYTLTVPVKPVKVSFDNLLQFLNSL